MDEEELGVKAAGVLELRYKRFSSCVTKAGIESVKLTPEKRTYFHFLFVKKGIIAAELIKEAADLLDNPAYATPKAGQVRRPLKLMQVICLLIYGWTPRNRIDWKPEEGKEFDMPDLFAEAAKGDQGAEGDEKDTAEIGGDAQATEAQPAVEANVPVAPRPWLVFPRSYTPADYERAEQAWTDGFPESEIPAALTWYYNYHKRAKKRTVRARQAAKDEKIKALQANKVAADAAAVALAQARHATAAGHACVRIATLAAETKKASTERGRQKQQGSKVKGPQSAKKDTPMLVRVGKRVVRGTLAAGARAAPYIGPFVSKASAAVGKVAGTVGRTGAGAARGVLQGLRRHTGPALKEGGKRVRLSANRLLESISGLRQMMRASDPAIRLPGGKRRRQSLGQRHRSVSTPGTGTKSAGNGDTRSVDKAERRVSSAGALTTPGPHTTAHKGRHSTAHKSRVRERTSDSGRRQEWDTEEAVQLPNPSPGDKDSGAKAGGLSDTRRQSDQAMEG